MKEAGRSLKIMTIMAMIIASMAACSKKNDNNSNLKNSLLQVVHAAPNVGELTLDFNGRRTQHKVQYAGTTKPYIAIQTKTDAVIKLALANNSIVAESKSTFDNNGNYTLFLYDTLKSSKIKFVVLRDNLSDPGAGKTNIRFLHLSPNTSPVDVDIFKGSDSTRLISVNAYVADNTNTTALSAFRVIPSGNYRVKVKTKTGTVINTVLDIPSIQLDAQRSITLYLKGLTNGATGAELGLQAWQHK